MPFASQQRRHQSQLRGSIRRSALSAASSEELPSVERRHAEHDVHHHNAREGDCRENRSAPGLKPAEHSSKRERSDAYPCAKAPHKLRENHGAVCNRVCGCECKTRCKPEESGDGRKMIYPIEGVERRKEPEDLSLIHISEPTR